MICPKCRVKIADSDKYCPRCGEVFDHSDLERLGNKLENDLLNIYSNKTWGRLNISVGYLFFNMFYALYKKMYYEAVIGGIANAIFVNIYYILRFDELYLTRAKGYISRIINEYGTSDVELLTKLCEKDSKGNLFAAIFPEILFIVVFVYLLFIH